MSLLSRKNSGCHEIQTDSEVNLIKVNVSIHTQQPLMSRTHTFKVCVLLILSINESEYVTFLLLVACFSVVLTKVTCWPENNYLCYQRGVTSQKTVIFSHTVTASPTIFTSIFSYVYFHVSLPECRIKT